jgi:methylated-DNA-[protein]-cysteine S-methyltransferase
MPTQFQERVYSIVRKIPKGETMSYGEIADILHSSPRAVGQALKRNPYAPIVPCHRVIHADTTA